MNTRVPFSRHPEGGCLSALKPQASSLKPAAAALGALVLALALPAFAGDVRMEVVGTWGGAVNTVFVDPAAPDVAYIGSGRRLVILNVADPGNIQELGSLDLGELVMDLKVRDGYAYVATYFSPNKFCVVDVSDPTQPALVWHYVGVAGFQPQQVELYGNYAYVRVMESWVDVFNIANPLSPVYVRRVIGGGRPAQIAVAGDYLYAVRTLDLPITLRIYDLAANPTTPPVLGETPIPSVGLHHAYSLCVTGGCAYVTSAGNVQDTTVLAVLDVSNPQAPAYLGSYGDLRPRALAKVRVANGVAYVADDTALNVLDVATDPASPSLLGTYTTHGESWGIGAVMGVGTVVGTRVYALDAGEGLLILDVSNPQQPVRLGAYHSPANLRDMDKVGDLLYVSDEWGGFSILDVSDARHPTLIGHYQSSEASGRWGSNGGIDVRDGLAYLAAGFGGLETVDISDPAQPTIAGQFPFQGPRAESARLSPLHDEIVHVGVSGSFIVNFHISDPGNIRDVGWVYLGGRRRAARHPHRSSGDSSRGPGRGLTCCGRSESPC